MKKFLLTIITSFSILCSKADFGISSSAICLAINGNTAFYNTQVSSGNIGIGKLALPANLGAFGSNSGNLKIAGASINTYRTNGATVCSGYLYYAVYLQGNKPANLVYSKINLDLFSTITSQEQWQLVNNGIDLTNLATGSYTLEIYYVASGGTASSSCSQQSLDNASGTDYTTNFIISSPLALQFSTLYGVVNDNSIQIKWIMQNDADIVSYEIQKSVTGLNFTTIDTITSKRSSTSASYSFTDNSPLTGANYYRIKANYFNSTINLSNVLRLYYEIVSNSILIYPNPSGNILTARLSGINRGNYQLSVLSNSGQQITTMPLNYNGIDETINIYLPITIPKGVYRLFMIDKTQFYKQAFLIK